MTSQWVVFRRLSFTAMKRIVTKNGKITIHDNSETAGVGVGFEVGERDCEGVGVVFGAAVGVGVSIGEVVAGSVEGRGVGDEFTVTEFEEVTFTNALYASFGFPLLSRSPKLESALTA